MPRHLHRLPSHASRDIGLAPSEAAGSASRRLVARRFRVVTRSSANGFEISAERGRLKEAGNLLFHMSLLALLAALAVGKLWGYEGNILVTEENGFCNSFQQYDRYTAGPLVDQGKLTPLCFDVDDFKAAYEPNGTAAAYTADIGVQERPGAPVTRRTIGVNDPLRIDGDRLYVTGHGFTPSFTVTLPDGRTFEQLSAPFLPKDSRTLGSEGVVKLADLGDGTGDGFALQGFFAPTGVVANGVLTSVDPRPLDPQVAIVAYRGYLGLDSGLPQSVFTLDQRQVDVGALKRVGAANLAVGASAALEDGTTVRFDGYREFAAMQVSHDPAQTAVLISALLMLGGLLANLLLRQERAFVRVTSRSSAPDAKRGGSTVTAASLARGGRSDAVLDPTALLDELDDASPATPDATST